MKDWKKEFDKEFLEDRKGMTVYALAPDLKFFISSLLDQSYSQGRLDREREIDKKYNELIMAVESKHRSETRHETALRYIKNAERGSDQVFSSLDKTDKEEKLTKED